VSKERPPGPIERIQDELDALPEASGAVLFPEVQVSRQFAFHVLKLPDRPEPTWHRWLPQAFEAAQYAGHDHLTMVIGDTQYQLSLIRGDP